MTRFLPALLFVALAAAALADPAVHLHPAFPLRDAAGAEVPADAAAAGATVAATATCGNCHDAAFIAAHDSHGAAARDAGARTVLASQDIDCFTCHIPAGAADLAATAATGDGTVHPRLGPPTAAACGQCHGTVDLGQEPLVLADAAYLAGDPHGTASQTLATGSVFSAQPVAQSYLNLADKAARTAPWDVHAARGLTCVSCHVSPNDPASAALDERRRQPHLRRDPRTLTVEAYLARPDHRLVSVACDVCHDPTATHDALPSLARHLEALACQACHVPDVPTPTPSVIDRTVVTIAGGPRYELRGVAEREWEDRPNTWFSTGYQPFLLSERDSAAATRLAPYNVQATWYWVDRAAGARPVPAEVLRGVWLDTGGRHHPDIVRLLDRDQDGRLASDELVLDRDDRVEAIRARLRAAGVTEPAIVGKVTAHPVRHGVVDGARALAGCRDCHAVDSRLTAAIPLATRPLPGGVLPQVSEATGDLLGERQLVHSAGVGLWLSTGAPPADRYVIGQARPWSDVVGLLFFGGTLCGVVVHAWLRRRAARAAVVHLAPRTQRVYMYGAYERVWHWLMAFCVVMLLLTGVRIHFAGTLPFVSYPTAVFLHDLVAALFIVNAFLSLFYHVTTAEIRQFIPARDRFVPRILAQVRFYVRGIFARAAHPLARTPQAKLNPLQQVTYFGLLNVLFPLQIATGMLMWTAGRWPSLVAPVGGLAVVAPGHNLGSWLLLTFLVMHVYLTTTGHTLTSNVKAMVDGWDEVEAEALASPRRGVEHV